MTREEIISIIRESPLAFMLTEMEIINLSIELFERYCTAGITYITEEKNRNKHLKLTEILK